VPIGNVSLAGQCMKIDRTASESGGRRDVRADLKTRAAERTSMIPDIAMAAVRRLADRDAPGRERSEGRLYGCLINGDRGGYLGYAMWRRHLKLAQGYTAAHCRATSVVRTDRGSPASYGEDDAGAAIGACPGRCRDG
jgi:hypothetical protein